jgi:NADP-dependent 3-hydroxy acid dehydrogenase YdfG
MGIRRAIVTGGASGMGRATTLELLAGGYAVAVFDRNEIGLASLRAAADPARLTLHAVDVTDFAAVNSAVEGIATDGGFDALVACAGVHDRALLAEGDPERWRAVFDVNVLGVANCLRACLPHLTRRELADIVVWGSVSGWVPYTHEAMYAASKAAVIHLVNCLRLEVVDTAVRVCVLEPGLVDTPMTRANESAMSTVAQLDPILPEDIARCARFILDQPSHCNISELTLRPSRQTM